MGNYKYTYLLSRPFEHKIVVNAFEVFKMMESIEWQLEEFEKKDFIIHESFIDNELIKVSIGLKKECKLGFSLHWDLLININNINDWMCYNVNLYEYDHWGHPVCNTNSANYLMENLNEVVLGYISDQDINTLTFL